MGWLTESYRMLGEARVEALRERVEAELRRSASGIDPALLEQLKAEVLFWAGEFDNAYQAATVVSSSRLPERWRAASCALRVTSSLFGGHVDRARELFERHRALLEQRPGLHHLEALIALKSGEAAKARELLKSRVESWERPKLVRAALALIEAEIALKLDESAHDKLDEALALEGDSWVAAAARALTSSRGASAAPSH
jgi:hypothetical protein